MLYVTSVAPFDADGLAREVADAPDVIAVTPFLEGTLTPMLTAALADRPSRFTSIGVGGDVLREYGTVVDHDRARGLDEPASASGSRASSSGSLRRVPCRR